MKINVRTHMILLLCFCMLSIFLAYKIISFQIKKSRNLGFSAGVQQIADSALEKGRVQIVTKDSNGNLKTVTLILERGSSY